MSIFNIGGGSMQKHNDAYESGGHQHDVVTKPKPPKSAIFPQINVREELMHNGESYTHAHLLSPVHSPKRTHQFQPGCSGGAAPSTTMGMTLKNACLCSPTTHVGSFRCRLHRNGSQMRRGHSVGSNLSDLANKMSSNNIKPANSSGLHKFGQGITG